MLPQFMIALGSSHQGGSEFLHPQYPTAGPTLGCSEVHNMARREEEDSGIRASHWRGPLKEVIEEEDLQYTNHCPAWCKFATQRENTGDADFVKSSEQL